MEIISQRDFLNGEDQRKMLFYADSKNILFMKPILLILLLLTCFSVILFAQNTPTVKIITHRYDSSTVIHDSTGRIIPYHEWSALMASGGYIIKTDQDSAGREWLLLKWLSHAERQRMSDKSPDQLSPDFPKGRALQFSANGIDGKVYELAALKGRPVLLHLMILEHYPEVQLPLYNELVDSFGKDGRMLFLAITADKEDMAKKLLEGIDFRFVVLADQQKLLDTWGIHSYPQDVLLDKEGRIFYSSRGFGNATIFLLGRKTRELLKE